MPTRYERADARILGNRLRAAREARGMTQQAAADAIGVVRTTIVAMEKGERKPREGELLQLAELYGQDVHVLLRPFDPVPAESSLVGHFRRTARADAAMERKLQACVEDVQRMMLGYRELEGIYGAAVPRIRAPDHQVPGDHDQHGLSLGPAVVRIAEEVAAAERNRLGFGDAPIGVWSTCWRKKRRPLASSSWTCPTPSSRTTAATTPWARAS